MYFVSVRARSAVALERDRLWTLPWSDVGGLLRSEFAGDYGYAVALNGIVRGEADTLEAALLKYSGGIASVLPLVALLGNGAIDDPRPVSAHGVLVGTSPCEWESHEWPPSDALDPPAAREIDTDVLDRAFRAGLALAEPSLFGRAVAHYAQALRHCTPEHALLCGEYLWMAAEAFSLARVEILATAKGWKKTTLARSRRVQPGDLPRLELQQLFDGHADVLRDLEAASNGFEHGYMDFDEARRLFTGTLASAFSVLRKALINQLQLPQADVDHLMRADLQQPRSLDPVRRFARGRLEPIRDSDVELGDTVDALWTAGPVRAISGEDGAVSLQRPAELTFETVPEGVSIRVEGLGIRGPAISGLSIDTDDVDSIADLWPDRDQRGSERKLREFSVESEPERRILEAVTRMAFWALRSAPLDAEPTADGSNLSDAQLRQLASWQMLLIGVRSARATMLVAASGYCEQALVSAQVVDRLAREATQMKNGATPKDWLENRTYAPSPEGANAIPPGSLITLLSKGSPTQPIIEAARRPPEEKAIFFTVALRLRTITLVFAEAASLTIDGLSKLDAAVTSVRDSTE